MPCELDQVLLLKGFSLHIHPTLAPQARQATLSNGQSQI